MGRLTAAVLRVEVFIDGVQRVLLLAAIFAGPQDVSNTLVQEGILTLEHRSDPIRFWFGVRTK